MKRFHFDALEEEGPAAIGGNKVGKTSEAPAGQGDQEDHLKVEKSRPDKCEKD